MQAADSIPVCQRLFGAAYAYNHSNDYQKCFDTMKVFVEHCTTDIRGHLAFFQMQTAIQNIDMTDTLRYAKFRAWLESVFYLNITDPDYWCACVETIMWTYQTNAEALGLDQWLIQNSDCDTSFLKTSYSRARNAEYQQWRLGDTTKPLDTTLLTIKQLGLDSLLGLHLTKGIWQPQIYSDMLASLSVSENPLKRTTILRFESIRPAYVRVEAYDELGRMIVGDGSGHVYDPGRHELPVDLTGHASGVYYLRVSLGNGEVRTIKLVKKE